VGAQKSVARKTGALALDMEEPLNAVREALHALRLMGHGLAELGDDDEGRAIAATAWTACQRFDGLQQIWRSLCKIALRT
jgi:hypothetical protein